MRIENTSELKATLKSALEDKDYYSIYPDRNFRFDTVCYIKPKGGKWEIGVFERGGYHDVHAFDTEAEACEAFLKEFYPELLK